MCLFLNFATNARLLARILQAHAHHFSLQGEWVLSGRSCDDSKLFHLYMYSVKCENVGFSKDPLLTLVSDFAILFGNELDSEVFYFPFRNLC